MKKLILLITVFAGISTLNAASQNYADFKKWAEGVKTDWLRWEGKLVQDKYNLYADQAAEWFKFGIEQNAAFSNLTELKNRDSLFENQLEKAVEVYEKLEQDNARFWKNKHEEALAKADVFKKQLKDLKIKFGLEKPEAEVKDKDAKPSDANAKKETEQTVEEGATKPAIADQLGKELSEADEDEASE